MAGNWAAYRRCLPALPWKPILSLYGTIVSCHLDSPLPFYRIQQPPLLDILGNVSEYLLQGWNREGNAQFITNSDGMTVRDRGGSPHDNDQAMISTLR